MAQMMAVIIFVLMFLLIITEKVERHVVTLVCGFLTLLFVFGIGMHSVNAIIDTLN